MARVVQRDRHLTLAGRDALRHSVPDQGLKEGAGSRLDWMGQDLKAGLRMLARRPGFSLFAITTLALGLSTSTAVFTYVNAYGRPFPGVGAKNLHQVWSASQEEPWGAFSYPDYEDLADLGGTQFRVTGVGRATFAATVRREQVAEVSFGGAVVGSFFSVLGIEMAAGRGFSQEDDRQGAPPATVISHEYWVSRYDADPDLPGQTILLNNEVYTIVGVAGPEFLGVSSAYRPQFWLPFEQFLRVYRPGSDIRDNRGRGAILPIVRLGDEVAVAGMDDALRSLATGLDREVPLADRTRRFVLEPATWIGPVARDAEASTTRIMMAAAGFLLLLACANVANLLLSAGAGRDFEIAIRRAVGASRGRLVRQLLTESLLLSAPAGVVAFALAGPFSGRLSSYFARPSVWGANVPRDIVVDPQVVLFAFFIALATGAAAGLLPALRVSARSPADALGTRGTESSAGRRPRAWLPETRGFLVSSQIAICVVLLFVAALVLRTLETTQRVDPGFDTSRTLASYVSTSSMGVPIPERHGFFQELIHRFEELPWVEAATVAENAPLSGHPTQGLIPQDGVDPVITTIARVWPGYFEVLEMDIRRGGGHRERIACEAPRTRRICRRAYAGVARRRRRAGSGLRGRGSRRRRPPGDVARRPGAGVFAVVALAVASRRREIGIRMAVGADRISIAKSVLGPVSVSVFAGLGVGLAGAFGATRLVESLLWGVAPADPLALGIGVGVLLVAVVLAVLVPVRRALGVDPVTSLRAE